MDIIAEFVISALLVISGVFGLVGSFGLVKLKDTMQRLHAPTKATTLGVGGILFASMGYAWAFGYQGSLHELLITLFLFITAPITANFISKAHMLRNVGRKELPESQSKYDWAGYCELPPPEQHVRPGE